MIWATVISRSCFCRLYRASPSLDAKSIISLISVSTIWWCPCVESSFVLLEEGVCYDQCVSWQNSISLCHASFCTPTPNLLVTPGISWLPSFAFQSPMMKRTSFGGLVLGFVGLHGTIQFQLLQHYWRGIDLGYCDLNGLPWKWTKIIPSLLKLHPSTAFWTLVGYKGYSISSKEFLPTVVDV